jgi:hypothetical protein
MVATKGTGFTHEATIGGSCEWYTPPRIFDALGIEFDLDPASPGKHIVSWVPAERHLTVVEDGLTTPWEGRVWLNPPYGRTVTPKWLARLTEHGDGIALVFSRTDTEWFHEYALRADMICFIRGRLKFIKPDGAVGDNPGCGSMLLAFGKKCSQIVAGCGLGWVVDLQHGRQQAASKMKERRLF